jgi:hypothetical protein
MPSRLHDEWTRLRTALRHVDAQAATVLTLASFLVVLQFVLGSRSLFLRAFGMLLPSDWRGLASWGWWFGMQGVLGFVIPVVVLRAVFRQSWHAMGLGLGDWKLASSLAGVYLVGVAVATWVLSDGSGFQAQYPHHKPAARDWSVFLVYEALFLFYWIGWEYLWRGFALFGTRHALGLSAIFVQTVPFAALHVDKPWPEALLSVVGGIALGALVWRCRSFWIAVPIHAAQMMVLDFWCTLRVRSGASGIGWAALQEALRALG